MRFKVKPYSLNKRRSNSIKQLNFMIREILNGKDYFIQNLSKEVVRLSEIESEILLRKPYTYFYTEVEKRFIKNKSHIVHEAMRLRRKKVSRKEIMNFIPKIKNYINYMGN